MIICLILITKQIILCEYYKENLLSNELAWGERVNNIILILIVFTSWLHRPAK